MRRGDRALRTAWVVVLVWASVARAAPAVTKDVARLREGPGAASPLVGTLPPGTRVDVLGDSGGWRQVQTSDGRTGWVFNEHLASEQEGEAAPRRPPDPLPVPAPADRPAPGSVLDEVRALRIEVGQLRERPEPATAADLERVRAEVERLAAAERDLARRLDEHVPGAPAADPLPDGGSLLSLLLLLVGAIAGWMLSRLAQRRRDGRQRNRLRL